MRVTRGLPNSRRAIAQGVLVLFTLVTVSGCTQQSRRYFGLERTPPDEFLVVNHVPLTVPPDFGLRPPAPNTSRPGLKSPTEIGKDTLLKYEDRVDPNLAPAKRSANEKPRPDADLALVKRSGGNVGSLSANANIRFELDRDLLQRQAESPEILRLLNSGN